MSLESIYRVISTAEKAAAAVNSGTAEEKAAMNVLSGLSAMLEARVQLHKHATPATLSAEAHAADRAQPTVAAPKRPVPAAAPRASVDGLQRRAVSDDGEYDLK